MPAAAETSAVAVLSMEQSRLVEHSRLDEIRARFEACYNHAVRLADGPHDTLSVVECNECLTEVDALMDIAGNEAERALWRLRNARALASDVAATSALAVLAVVPLVLVVFTGFVLCVGLRFGGRDANGVMADIVIVTGLYIVGSLALAKWSASCGGALGLMTWLNFHQRCCPTGFDHNGQGDELGPAAALDKLWGLAEQGNVIIGFATKALQRHAIAYNDPKERWRVCAAPWGASAALLVLEFAICVAAGLGWLFTSAFAATAAVAFGTGATAVAIAPRGVGVDYPQFPTLLEWFFAMVGRSPVFIAGGLLMFAGVSPLLEAQLDPLSAVAESRLDTAEEALAATRRMQQALFAKMMGAIVPASLVEKVITGSTFTEKAEHLQELSANAGDHAKVLAMSGARLLPSRIRPETARAQARLRTAAVGVGNIVGGVASKVTAVTGLAAPREPKNRQRGSVGNTSSDGGGETDMSSGSAATSSGMAGQTQHTPMRQVWSGVKQLTGAVLNSTKTIEATGEPTERLEEEDDEEDLDDEESDAAAMKGLDMTSALSACA
eukprot:TRINITY_DN20499_c2_g1_i1.p1 TRINITY_DN20499_c2_g1~~TRINITY_DN20499_c2_g1_i1.p1  ORF type:complete len:586 (-),score=94.60 TRINITY_DN20499_c2_g1_i1:270-1931(-)